MNAPLDPEDRFGAHDDSLADDAAPPTDAARPWLAKQRFVHGMLRALNTADADAREARVQAVLDRLQPRARRWPIFLMAAAAVVLALLTAWRFWPDFATIPRAEAMVARALASLAEPIDRAFELRVDVERGARHVERKVEVVMRPGRRFVATLEGPLGKMQVGCDGERVWLRPQTGTFKMDVPYAEARRLTERMGDVLDLGYLDLEQLLRRLPQDTELRSVGREDGCVRVEATGTVALRNLEVRSISVLVDDQTGMVRAIEATALGKPEGARKALEARLRYRHTGDPALGDDAYRRPW
jgi:hypothetical protein